MKKTIIAIVLATLCLFFKTEAQSLTNIKPLKIGDTIPETVWNMPLQVVNHPTGKQVITLNDYKDKLIILDFWATWCTPCLKLLPKYDSISRQPKNKSFQFLLVTSETNKNAPNYLTKQNYDLSSVIGDTILSKLFPHSSIPHGVWIRKGKIIAATHGDDINETTIEQALSDQTMKVNPKKDNLTFQNLEPLLINGNGGNSKIYYHSLITPFIEGLNILETYSKNEGRIISAAINTSIVALYHQALGHKDPLLSFDNRTIIEVDDTLKYKLIKPDNISTHKWIKENGYCYNLVLPPNYKNNISTTMQGDLNRFFDCRYGIVGRLEKRTLDCLVLSRKAKSNSLKTKGGIEIFQSDSTHIEIKNQPISVLVLLLAHQHRKLSTPLIDETGYTGPIDLVLNINKNSSIENLRNALLQTGLDLQIKKRTIDMLVITRTL